MSAQQMIGWVAWAVLALFAISWSVQCYLYIKRRGCVTYATLNTTIVWWFLLGWTFHYSSVNKLHLFWLAPSAILIARFVTISRAISSMGEKRMLPPGLFFFEITLFLLGGYGLVLWWLID
jgi:4-hydroxybenzoate polyprenyltransferase